MGITFAEAIWRLVIFNYFLSLFKYGFIRTFFPDADGLHLSLNQQ